MKLSALAPTLAVCRLDAKASIPEWATRGVFFSVSRTDEELSVVCEEALVPEGIQCEKNWRALKVAGPLDFALTGILASIASPLAEAGISLFAVSTFDTDYILVKSQDFERASTVLGL